MRKDRYRSLGSMEFEPRQLMDGDPFAESAIVSTEDETRASIDTTLNTTADPLTPADRLAWDATNAPAGSLGILNQPHGGYFYDVAISPKGDIFATTGRDTTVKLFDASTGAFVRELAGHGKLVLSAAFSPDGTKLATTGHDCTVKIWDPSTGALLKTIPLSANGNDMKFLPDGSGVVVAVDYSGATIVNIETGVQKTLGGWSHVAVSPVGNLISYAEADVVRVFDTAQNKVVGNISLGAYTPAMAFSANGAHFFAASGNGTVKVVRADTWQEIVSFAGPAGAADAEIDASGEYLSVSYGNGQVQVFDVSSLIAGETTPVKTFSVPGRPGNISMSPNGYSVITTSFHDAQNVTNLVAFQIETPPAPPAPAPEPIADPAIVDAVFSDEEGFDETYDDINPALHEATISSLSAEIAAASVEENNSIGYAKMEGSFEFLGQTPRYHARFRSPEDQTVMRIVMKGSDGSIRRTTETIAHPGGTEEMQWQHTPNEILADYVTVTIEMRSIANGPVIDQVMMYFTKGYNRPHSIDMYTEQLPWDNDEMGRMVENPVTPEARIAKITGNNVLIAIQSPHDHSVVKLDGGGLLSQQTVAHEGGTTLALSSLTFNAAKASGVYNLKVYDRLNGMVLETIPLAWKKEAGTLSVQDPDDHLNANIMGPFPTSVEEEAAMLEFNKVNAIASIDLDNASLARIQQMQMYEATRNLPEGQRLHMTFNEFMERYFYVRYPEYKGENWEATIDMRWGGNPYVTRGSVENTFHNERLAAEGGARDRMAVYEQAMCEIMDLAMRVIVGIRQGQSEEVLWADVQRRIDMWNGNINISQLVSYGVRIPDAGTCIAAARQVFENDMEILVNMQNEVISYRAHADRMRENGLIENAKGEWVAAGGRIESIAPEMSRREITTARRIRDALNAVNDPRVIAWSNIKRDAFSASVASLTNPLSSDDYIANVTLVVMSFTDSDIDLDDPQLEGVAGVIAMKDLVNRMDQQAVYEDVTSIYNNVGAVSYPQIGGRYVRNDTAVGKIFLGLYQNAFSMTDISMKLFFAKIEKVTGIPAERLWFGARERDYQKFADVLFSNFGSKGYGHIFMDQPQTPQTSDSIVEVSVDGYEYNDTSSRVRVHFDFAGSDALFDRGNVYLIRADGIQIGNLPLINDFHGKLFVDIPVSQLNVSNPGAALEGVFKLKLALWKNAGDSSGIQGDFYSPLFHVELSGNTVVDPADTAATPLSQEKINSIKEALDFGNLSTLPRNKQIIDWLITNYLSSGELQFDPATNEWIGTRYDNSQNENAGECKWWVNEVVKEATEGNINLPTLKASETGSSFAWNDSGDLELISQNQSTGTLDDIFLQPMLGEELYAGDLVQYTKGNWQHTIIIGSINPTGVWVFDSNYGLDDTPRYHFMSYDQIEKIEKFSIYRIKNG